jgi:hypothetical protein
MVVSLFLSSSLKKKFSTSPVDKPVDKMLKTNWRLFPLNHLQFPNFECLSILGIISN